MKIKELYRIAHEEISKISDVPQLETLILLEYTTGFKREKIFAYPDKIIKAQNVKAFFNIVENRVKNRVPISYLINEREFYSLKFFVDENVLIPRPETEKIVDLSLNILKKNSLSRVLDIGTGSGNIITAISYYNRAKAKYFASDISYNAIKIAKMNAKKYKQKINFFVSDIFSGVKNKKKFDLIVVNPPYISKKEKRKLAPEILNEPETALFAEEDGVYYIKKLIDESRSVLKNDGIIIIEIGETQSNKIKLKVNMKIIKDDFDKERFIIYSP